MSNMFGSREISGLLDTSGLTANVGKKKGEVDSATLHIKKSKFVPKIDLSRQVKIHRRRRKHKALAASSADAKNSVLFQEEEEEGEGEGEDAQQQQKLFAVGSGKDEDEDRMRRMAHGARVYQPGIVLSKEAVLAASKPASGEEEIRIDPEKLAQMRRKDADLEDEVAEARRMRMLLRRKQRADSDSDSESESDGNAESKDGDDRAQASKVKDRHEAKADSSTVHYKAGAVMSSAHASSEGSTKSIPSGGGKKDGKVIGSDATVIVKPTPVDVVNEGKSAVEEEESGSSSGSSESESSSGEESDAPQLRFVPRHLRKTIVTEEEAAALEEQRAQAEREKRQVLAQQTRVMVAEQLEARKAAELEEKKKDDEAFIFARAGMPDDTDGVDEEKEYEDWKARELQRLKRDLEEAHRYEFEQAEIERRRKLTEEERKKEDEALIKAGKKKGEEREKGQMQFMQKYYHKGAFYMDEETIQKSQASQAGKVDPRLKDYTQAVERDRRNADVLPEVMHRRGGDFGKKGGTKWTHLTAEDTSNFKDSLFYQGEKERKKNRNG